MIIKVTNLLDKTAPYSYLSASVASGTNVLGWKNSNQFYANWAIQIGQTGEEKAEVLVLGTASPSGTAGTTTANTRYDHPTDTPVYSIKYDQVVFMRSTAGTAGTATDLTDGTVTITPDSLYTQVDDTSGAASYAYKAYYRNSVTGDYSSQSDWMIPAGYTFYSLNRIRERAKNKLFSANYIKSDGVVDDWINEWTERMNNTLIDVNRDYSLGSVQVALGTSGLGTITSTDFKEVRKIDFTSDGVNWYTGQQISLTDFEPEESFNETHPYYYMYGDTVFGKKPSSAGTANVYYYKLPTILSDETDELATPMKGYTKSFVDYCMSQAYYLDGKKDEGDRYMAQAVGDLERFKQEVTPRHKSGPSYIKLTDPVSVDNYFEFL